MQIGSSGMETLVRQMLHAWIPGATGKRAGLKNRQSPAENQATQPVDCLTCCVTILASCNATSAMTRDELPGRRVDGKPVSAEKPVN